jgi:hypothetical protein
VLANARLAVTNRPVGSGPRNVLGSILVGHFGVQFDGLTVTPAADAPLGPRCSRL